MTPPEKTEPSAERVKSTTYIVLVFDPGNEAWYVVDEFYATNAEQAVRAAGKSRPDDMTFVAVPIRSWKPMTRKVEQRAHESWS